MSSVFETYSLQVGGSDSVDELVRRCKGDTHQAVSIVHAMIDNYLHFDDMRVESMMARLVKIRQELKELHAKFRNMSGDRGRYIEGTELVILGTDIQRLQNRERELVATIEAKSPRPERFNNHG